MTDSAVCNGESISHTSSSLLARAKAYDQAAWRRLFRLYGPLVYHWIRRKGIQPADAFDIGQQVFASVLASSPIFTVMARTIRFEAGSTRSPRTRSLTIAASWQGSGG
jgi:hypothetical protein